MCQNINQKFIIGPQPDFEHLGGNISKFKGREGATAGVTAGVTVGVTVGVNCGAPIPARPTSEDIPKY